MKNWSERKYVNNIIALRGMYRMIIGDPDGNPIEEINEQNVVVTAGRAWVLKQIQSSDHNTAQALSHAAVGTSTTAPATSDTGLGSESSRIAVNSFNTAGLTANPPYWQATASWATNQANTTLGEVGLFNSSSGGTMLSRATFATVNKTTSNTFAITYTISA